MHCSLHTIYNTIYSKLVIVSFVQSICLSPLSLSSPQLLVLHRLFYEQLAHLRYIPKDSRLEDFLVILERTAPSFSLYAGFQSEFFMQNLQVSWEWGCTFDIGMCLDIENKYNLI